MTWVPPGGGTPVGPTPSEPARPPAMPEAPPPAAPASVAPVAKPAGNAFTATALSVGIVGALIAGSLIGGIGTYVSGIVNPAPTYDPYPYDEVSGDYSDLAQGEPGEPTAVAPTECPSGCFDESSAEAAILEDAVFEDWGDLALFKHVWKMTGDRTTADLAHADAWEDWNGVGYSPDECFVTWNEMPIVEAETAQPTADFVAPLTEHSSDDYSFTELTQSVRLFEDSRTAEQYMLTLDAGLEECTRYHDPNGYPTDAVTREPGLHPPDSVAAVGFVRNQAGIRFYVMDVQRGNMVIRSVAYSDGGIDDTRFRQLMMKQATLLGELPLAG